MPPLTYQRKVPDLPLLSSFGSSCCQPWGVTGANLYGEPSACIPEPFPASSSLAGRSSGCRGGESRTRSGALAPRPSRGCADSSGRGSAGGAMWLPGRLVYCAGNKGTVVPGLLKCLGVWPLPCAGGWSTLGSRPGRGTLLRNASSSIAFCLGLGCPLTLPAGFMPRGVWCLTAPSLLPMLSLAEWGSPAPQLSEVRGPCCHPKRNAIRLCCQF